MKTLLKSVTKTKPESAPILDTENSFPMTVSEARDLSELSYAIHGLYQILANNQSEVEALDVANLLVPIDNQLCDLQEKLSRRAGLRKAANS